MYISPLTIGCAYILFYSRVLPYFTHYILRIKWGTLKLARKRYLCGRGVTGYLRRRAQCGARTIDGPDRWTDGLMDDDAATAAAGRRGKIKNERWSKREPRKRENPPPINIFVRTPTDLRRRHRRLRERRSSFFDAPTAPRHPTAVVFISRRSFCRTLHTMSCPTLVPHHHRNLHGFRNLHPPTLQVHVDCGLSRLPATVVIVAVVVVVARCRTTTTTNTTPSPSRPPPQSPSL